MLQFLHWRTAADGRLLPLAIQLGGSLRKMQHSTLNAGKPGTCQAQQRGLRHRTTQAAAKRRKGRQGQRGRTRCEPAHRSWRLSGARPLDADLSHGDV